MRPLLVTVLLVLTGCSGAVWVRPRPEPIPQPPPAPIKQTALHEVWEKEVAQDLAIFKAIRPSLSGPPPALNLYDSATQGLASLSGEPTAKAVEQFQSLVLKPDDKVLAALRAEKVALDQRTNELEAEAAAERDARLIAEGKAEAAKEEARQSAIQARKAESVSKLTTVGAAAAGVGVLALLFGSWLNISKLTAGLVIAAGIGIAAAAPWLVDLAEMKWVIIGLLSFLGTDVVIFVAIKTWRYLSPKPDAQA